MNISDEIKKIASVDPLTEGKQENLFVGHPFTLDYFKSNVLICDDDKKRVNGIAQGTFLLAFYDNEETVEEAVLLRALNPAKLPTDSANISSMIEYYKDNLATSGKDSKLDNYTRYEFSFSGLECRVLGTFYRGLDGKVEFGADLENFYSAHHYSVYKVNNDVLGYIVNQRDSPDIIPGNDNEFPIGVVRYSSTLRFQNKTEKAKVYINPTDLLGKRSALFGMTRTGKSNTVKKIIQATTEISAKAKSDLEADWKKEHSKEKLSPFSDGAPKYPVGQIIFDVNGEYANPNIQDKGSAIFEMYKEQVTRYSVLDKDDFLVMKINFFSDIENGFEMISSYFRATGQGNTGYLQNFLSIDLIKPLDYDGFNSTSTRYDRKVAAYKCCLYKAGFKTSGPNKIKFKGNINLNEKIRESSVIDPSKFINYDDACLWFEWVWENCETDEFFQKYKKEKGKEWIDEDLKSVLAMLSGFRSPGKKNKVYGYKALGRREIIDLHTNKTDSSFEKDITNELRKGKIVIVDLSQGNPEIQRVFSEKICQSIFSHSMGKFIDNSHNNFIQFYFEEAHNLFPKKDDKDLSQIYNRIAKEGAKLNLGMIYATQEVSSISSNILKNTQNWFIAHLNNEDEIKELRKYYDFNDFADALTRFSAKNDKGFVRMKTYSNPFVVPVQIDKFSVSDKK